ncbi:hypothetical protein L6019_RS23255 [Escherichia coli]|nr:hypothetical protein [Escherichia coli]EKG7113471.1 hypothetical protein [Escherichia coli]ELM8776566.1 hypothetical protein [Escherichia coli]EMA4402900.1 hypothetical protein [Escherichia coli]HAH8500925.1 hypothetical protein [Escherichia coli]
MPDEQKGWPFHIENYTKLALETGVSIAAYAEMYGLNPNTCRRHLRKPSDKKASTPRKKPLITDHPDDLFADQQARKDERAEKRARKNRELEEVDGHESTLAGGKAIFDNDGKLIRFTKAPRGSIETRFKPGNKANRPLHGAYATPTDEDIARAQVLIESGVMDSIDEYLISHNLAHLLLISQSRDRSVQIFNEQEAEQEREKSGKKKKRKNSDEPERPEIPAEFKKLSMLVNSSEAIASITRNLTAMRQVLDKRRKEEEKRDLDGEYREAIVNAYRLQEQRNWTALETAIYIERQGFKVPSTLASLVQNELKQPPPIDETPTVDEDELERQAREYRARQEGAQQAVDERRRAVAEIVDSRGYGDIDHNGELRGDMDYGYDDDDGEEWDDDVPDSWGESPGGEE